MVSWESLISVISFILFFIFCNYSFLVWAHVRIQALEVAQLAAPLGGAVDAVSVKLVQEHVGVLLDEVGVVLCLKLGIQEVGVALAQLPLVRWAELLDGGELPCFVGLVLCVVLIGPQLKLIIQL